MAPGAANSTVVRFGVFEANLRTGELRKQGIRIKLQDQPFQILAMLLERPGELVTREQIQQKLWPQDTFVDFDHSLNTAVARLREALGDTADNPRFIETLPRRGYRFIGQVDSGVARPPSAAPAPRRLQTAAAVAIPLAIALAVGLAWLLRPRPAIESIAVLPFLNATNDPELDYLSDGIAESLIDNLSGIPGLRVLSRNSAFQLKNVHLNTRDLATRLGVRGLVVGSVRRQGENLHVVAELVDGRDDRHLWSREFDLTQAQLATFQPMLVRDLFDGLRLRLDRNAQLRLAQQRTSNPAAYDAYLRGRFSVRSRDPKQIQQAVIYFQQAIDLDPNYALPYAGLADAYDLLAVNGVLTPKAALPLADAAAQRALQLGPDLAKAHVTAAYNWINIHRNWAAAFDEVKRALALDPNLSDAHHAYSTFLADEARFDEALEQERIVMLLDPEWPLARATYAGWLTFSGRYREAEDFVKARMPTPDGGFQLAFVYFEQGRYQEALEAIGETKTDHPLLTAIYVRLGRRREAEAMLRRALEKRQATYLPASRIATYYAVLDDRDHAIQWLNTAVDEHDFMGGIKINPAFRPLHHDPRFHEIVRKLRTPIP